MKRRPLFISLSVMVVLVAGALAVYFLTDIGIVPVDTVSVRLSAPLDAQSVGIVIAEEKGFFRRNGLAVSCEPGSGRVDPVRSVGSGIHMFGFASAKEIIVARSRGLPIVAVAALLQYSGETPAIASYPQVVFTTDKMVSEFPERVKLFLDAFLRGWRDVIDDPEKAVSTLVSQNKGLDQEHEIVALRALIPLLIADINGRIGWMEYAPWKALYEELEAHGLLDDQFDPSEAYTTRFIDEIYRRD